MQREVGGRPPSPCGVLVPQPSHQSFSPVSETPEAPDWGFWFRETSRMPGALGSIPVITVEALETGLGGWTLQAPLPWLGCSGSPSPQQPQPQGRAVGCGHTWCGRSEHSTPCCLDPWVISLKRSAPSGPWAGAVPTSVPPAPLPAETGRTGAPAAPLLMGKGSPGWAPFDLAPHPQRSHCRLGL